MQMKLREFLKSNLDLEYSYFPNHPEPMKKHQTIIWFRNDDRTGRDKELSGLLKELKLPYSIHMRKSCFFYLILPCLYD